MHLWGKRGVMLALNRRLSSSSWRNFIWILDNFPLVSNLFFLRKLFRNCFIVAEHPGGNELSEIFYLDGGKQVARLWILASPPHTNTQIRGLSMFSSGQELTSSDRIGVHLRAPIGLIGSYLKSSWQPWPRVPFIYLSIIFEQQPITH